MLKGTLFIVAVALAGCASTSGWRALRIDGTSRSTFEASNFALQQGLSANQRLRFKIALQELWRTGAAQAGAEGGVDGASTSYYAQLDGLGYEEIVSRAGPIATQKYLEAWSHTGPRGDLGAPSVPPGAFAGL
jgi:hypothetical protein